MKSKRGYDSRSSEVAEYPLGKSSTRALRYLAVKLRDMVDLAREFRDVDDFDAKQGIAFFKETGLVFEENERFFSLVIEPAIARTALSSKST